MATRDDPKREHKTCARCGARAYYCDSTIVPGNPSAPRGSRGAMAHAQPAWRCWSCGYLEAEERRASIVHRQAG